MTTPDEADLLAGLAGALARDGRTPAAIVTRDGSVAAVVMQDATHRFTIVAERRDEGWIVPGLLRGTGRIGNTMRPAASRAWDALREVAIQQTGAPAADGDRPEVGWLTVTGMAATDAREIDLSSSVDNHRVPVADDGFFLALLKAAWGEQPDARVLLSNGEMLRVAL